MRVLHKAAEHVTTERRQRHQLPVQPAGKRRFSTSELTRRWKEARPTEHGSTNRSSNDSKSHKLFTYLPRHLQSEKVKWAVQKFQNTLYFLMVFASEWPEFPFKVCRHSEGLLKFILFRFFNCQCRNWLFLVIFFCLFVELNHLII